MLRVWDAPMTRPTRDIDFLGYTENSIDSLEAIIRAVRVTDTRLEVAAGVIEPGTVGAVRFETIGVVDGRDAIVIEHVNRMAPDLAPEWPTSERDGTDRIVGEGEPGLECELRLGGPDNFSEQGMLATAIRVVNAIPAVCR